MLIKSTHCRLRSSFSNYIFFTGKIREWCNGYAARSCERDSVAGVLHVIDRVTMPVTNTTAQILQNDPRLTMFTDALSRIGFLHILNTSIPHTIFALTDEAFNNSRYS